MAAGLVDNSCQNISSAVGITKSEANAYKSSQNYAILLYRNNISRALPENNFTNSSLILHFDRGCLILQFIFVSLENNSINYSLILQLHCRRICLV